MKRLFAAESDNLDVNLPVSAGLSEVGGELNEVLLEINEDVTEVDDLASSAETADDAVKHLEGVHDFLDRQQEPMSEFALEAVRVAVAAIADRVGATPLVVGNMLATEDYSSLSARRSVQNVALEGVKDLLRDLWKRIKAAIKALLDKGRAFWNKHISALGRVKKALDKARERVENSTGKIKGSMVVEGAPSSLKNVFAGDEDISPSLVSKYISAHKVAIREYSVIAADIAEYSTQFQDLLKTTIADSEMRSVNRRTGKKKIQIASDNSPLIGGKYIEVTYTEAFGYESEFEFEWDEHVVDNKSNDVDIILADKKDLSGLIRDVNEIVDGEIKSRARSGDEMSAFNDQLRIAEKAVDELEHRSTKEDALFKSENIKDFRKAVRTLNKLVGKYISTQLKMRTYNIELARGVVLYVDFCLKHHR